MEFPIYFWLGFIFFIIFALALDLGVLHKKPKIPSMREAANMTAVWVMLSSLFCYFLYYQKGAAVALEFLTGYVIELCLSMDNVFVIAIIFTYLQVPQQYQHRVLFWGVLGAILMRLVMIVLGITLIEHFLFIFYVMGLVLIFSGIKIVLLKQESTALVDNSLVKFVQRFVPVTTELVNEKFFVKKAGGKGKKIWHATPLFIALLLVEKADLMFAIDSIPAILAITNDPFIVFTSNIFALLGLRSMYFMLASMMSRFVYLKYGLSGILVFIGCKMMLMPQGIKVPTVLSLTVVILFLSVSVILSWWATRKNVANG